eukprot:TRINITY_DN9027_c0_g1_i2.p1 TRINITY_DN9027_c0_g1~~TRINITY_DN9027_c0_g1_i2.p1  ORF type:complete len:764 (+),score=172.83 TRINITY_DN9027_c0_g1_i2:81-2372(+)
MKNLFIRASFFPQETPPVLQPCDVKKEGWLYVHEKKLIGGDWRKFWCVLTSKYFCCYEAQLKNGEDYRNPHCFVNLRKLGKVAPSQDRPEKQYVFRADTLDRWEQTFYYACENEESYHAWLEAMEAELTYSWVDIMQGQRLPKYVVCSEKSGDAIARNSRGECGMLEASKGVAGGIVAHHHGPARSAGGQILVRRRDTTVVWSPIKRGDTLPAYAVFSGTTHRDGDVYVARNLRGEVGKLNLDEGCMWNIWCPDRDHAEQHAEVLLLVPTPSPSGERGFGDSLMSVHSHSSPSLPHVQSGTPGSGPEVILSPTHANWEQQDPNEMLAVIEPVNKKSKEVVKTWVMRLKDCRETGQDDFVAGQYAHPPAESILGTGSFGEVWLAINKITGDPVAVKNMKVRINRNTEAVAKNELAVAERIRELQRLDHHPGIVRLYMIQRLDISASQRLYLLAMEYCPGGDLQDAVDANISGKNYRLTGYEELWSGQIFMALEHVHQRAKLLIRDLKLQNVVLDKPDGGNAKLVDFGYGRLNAESEGGNWTFGCPAGTPGYVAPEVFCREAYDFRVDLYSLGVVIWLLYSGGWTRVEQAQDALPPSICFIKPGLRPDSPEWQADWELIAEALADPSQGRLPVPDVVVDLILELTRREPQERPGHEEIRMSHFFEAIRLPSTDASMEEIARWQPRQEVQAQPSFQTADGGSSAASLKAEAAHSSEPAAASTGMAAAAADAKLFCCGTRTRAGTVEMADVLRQDGQPAGGGYANGK